MHWYNFYPLGNIYSMPQIVSASVIPGYLAMHVTNIYSIAQNIPGYNLDIHQYLKFRIRIRCYLHNNRLITSL